VFLSDLAQTMTLSASGDQSAARSDLKQQLAGLSPADRLERLTDFVRQQVAAIMRFASLDMIEPQQGFFRLGMDSLMAVELRNRLQTEVGCALPPTVTFDYPTASVLARFLADTLFPASASGLIAAVEPETEMPSELDGLSSAELKALLDEELRAFDEGVSA
jgi:acyl carrier protein